MADTGLRAVFVSCEYIKQQYVTDLLRSMPEFSVVYSVAFLSDICAFLEAHPVDALLLDDFALMPEQKKRIQMLRWRYANLKMIFLTAYSEFAPRYHADPANGFIFVVFRVEDVRRELARKSTLLPSPPFAHSNCLTKCIYMLRAWYAGRKHGVRRLRAETSEGFTHEQ